MNAIQTLRQGSYKLALGFTALVAALTLSMGAHASAHSFSLAVGFKTFNQSYRLYFTSDSGRTCTADFVVGEFWTVAYSKVRVVSSSHGCEIQTRVHTPGNQPAGQIATSTSGSWAQSGSTAYTQFAYANFFVSTYDCENLYGNWYCGYGQVGPTMYFRIDRYDYAGVVSGYYNGNAYPATGEDYL